MMLRLLSLVLVCAMVISGTSAFAQNGVLIDYVGTTRDASAVLDVRSADQGVLVPRISIPNLAAAAPVTTPAEGLLIYNTNVTTGVGYHYWNGTAWSKLRNGPTVPWADITGAPTSFAPSGAAGGDLSGTYPNPQVVDDSHNHTEIEAKPQYSWTASTAPRDFPQAIAASFVQAANGWPEYGSVLHVGTYPNDGGAMQLYAPYNSTYGGNSLRYRLGLYNNAGWTAWKTLWDDTNDGAGSGMDADLLDGQQGSYYATASGSANYIQNQIGSAQAANFWVNATGRAAAFQLNNANTSLTEGSGDALRMTTPTGYIDLGSQNASYAHIQTDRPRYYFNVGVTVDQGQISSYDEDLQLQTSGTTRITALNSNGNVGIGTAGPSRKLEVNGDIKLAYGYQLYFGESVTSNGKIGINFHTDGDPNYGIYKPAGAWTQPLHIGFYTGIKLGAHPSYGGTRFYSHSDMSTELMSVGNSDAHVRVANNLYVGAYGGHNSAPTTYGSLGLLQAKGGYYGLLFGQASSNPNIMYDGAGNGGIYYENLGRWSTYYLIGSNHLQINTSADLGATLGINGTLAVVDGTQGAGKVLVSNASGVASWVAPGSIGAGDNLGNHTATTTLNMNSQSITNATGLSFNNANPTISASSYFVAPGGAYFSSGTVYAEAAIQARGGINNDVGSFGGDVSITDNLRIQGVVTGVQGSYPSNNAIRMTPNFHFNNPAGYAMIVNWDNGAVGGGTQQFRVGNGQGTDQFYVRADGGFYGRWFADLDDGGYMLDPNSTSNSALRIRGGALHGPNPTWGAYLLVGGDGRNGYIDNGNTASVSATNGNLHMDAASGLDMYLNFYDGSNIHFGRGTSSTRATLDANGFYLYDGWLRPHGSSGLFFQTHGGGWNMEDATWLRTYGSKAILASGGVAGYGNSVFAGTYGTAPRIWGNYDNAGAGGIMVSDDGGFFDYNDAWIQFRGSTGLKVVTDNGSWDMIFSMCLTNGGCTYDKRVATETNAWGLLGASGNAWYQTWSYAFNNPSERELKKDITPVKGSVSDLVMADLDKMTPYLYRYNVEVDEWSEQNYAKYRTGVHMGLILDETPDYIQSQSYAGVDIYAVASLGVAASKHNREEIKQIKQSIGLSEQTMSIQDFGSAQLNGRETYIPFPSDFSAKLGSSLPIVTVTSNDPSVTLSVIEKSASGFKVISSASKSVTFDYIAMAKVTNTMVEPKEEIPAETMRRIRVDQSSKDKVIQYWKDEPKREAERLAKAQVEAVELQKKRAQEIYGNTASAMDPSVNLHPDRPEAVAPEAPVKAAEEIRFAPTDVKDPKNADKYDFKVEDASPKGEVPTKEKFDQGIPKQ